MTATVVPTGLFDQAEWARQRGNLLSATRLVRQVDIAGCSLDMAQLWLVELIEFDMAIASGSAGTWAEQFRRLADATHALGQPHATEATLIAEIAMQIESDQYMRALASISTLCDERDTVVSRARHELNVLYGRAVLRLGYSDIAQRHFEHLTKEFSCQDEPYLWGQAVEGLANCARATGGDVNPLVEQADEMAASTGYPILAAFAGSIRLVAKPPKSTDNYDDNHELAHATATLWRTLGHERRAKVCELRATHSYRSSISRGSSGCGTAHSIRSNPPDAELVATAKQLQMEDHPSLGLGGLQSQIVGSALARTHPMPTSPSADDPGDDESQDGEFTWPGNLDQPRVGPQPLTDVAAALEARIEAWAPTLEELSIELDCHLGATGMLVPIGQRLFETMIDWLLEATVGWTGDDGRIAIALDDEEHPPRVAIRVTASRPGDTPQPEMHDRFRAASSVAGLVGGHLDLRDSGTEPTVRIRLPVAAPHRVEVDAGDPTRLRVLDNGSGGGSRDVGPDFEAPSAETSGGRP